MASGGARNRSGPSLDINSARSEKRGLSLSALPASGYDGPIPEFPLPGASMRELDVWAELWRTPQAAAWASQIWRLDHVADYTRLRVRGEDPEVAVAIFTHIRQARSDLGLTPAGLKENGWAIAADEVGMKRDERPVEATVSSRRLRAVSE
jgi:hypothetical protein